MSAVGAAGHGRSSPTIPTPGNGPGGFDSRARGAR